MARSWVLMTAATKVTVDQRMQHPCVGWGNCRIIHSSVSGILEVWSWTSSLRITWKCVRKANSCPPPADQLNQKLCGWYPETCILTNLPGDSDVHSSFQITALNMTRIHLSPNSVSNAISYELCCSQPEVTLLFPSVLSYMPFESPFAFISLCLEYE